MGAMPRVAKGHVERLPSGSFRVVVYGGTDPITRREIRLKSTVRTEQQARIELGRLLKDASDGPPCHRGKQPRCPLVPSNWTMIITERDQGDGRYRVWKWQPNAHYAPPGDGFSPAPQWFR